jgi:FixJ family two-component response regulator
MLSQVRKVPERAPSLAADLQPTVFVVDDDLSVRESLESLIEGAGWHPETFASGEEFLSHAPIPGTSCLLLDYTLPDLDGLQVQQRIAAEQPEMSIIFITGHGDLPTTVKAMKAGAVEFLTKPFDKGVLIEAIKSAIQRSHAAQKWAQHVRTLANCHASLSARERQVMDLVLTGLLNKQVACQLGISEITVKAHRGRVMRKMKADSLAKLVTMGADLRRAGRLKA